MAPMSRFALTRVSSISKTTPFRTGVDGLVLVEEMAIARVAMERARSRVVVVVEAAVSVHMLRIVDSNEESS